MKKFCITNHDAGDDPATLTLDESESGARALSHAEQRGIREFGEPLPVRKACRRLTFQKAAELPLRYSTGPSGAVQNDLARVFME